MANVRVAVAAMLAASVSLTQLPQFGVCRDVKSADLLGFR